ncbi:MAG: hypothetical protein J7J25_03385 [Candidatus Omnitrophica bacterium]|nr:hypothetical protein [Candidatus Omnitrophota bacterium]
MIKTISPKEKIRLILYANSIPEEKIVFLKKVGIRCKEITAEDIKRIVSKHKYKLSEGVSGIRDKKYGYSVHKYNNNVLIDKKYARESLINLII